MKIECIDPLTSSRWTEFISRSPLSTVFHHPGWIGALATAYSYKPFAIVVSDDAGVLVGGLPMLEISSPWTGRRIVSLPFTDHCGGLFENSEVLNLIRSEVERMTNEGKYKYAEIRVNEIGGNFREGNQFALHQLAIQGDEQSIFKKFDQKSVQWGIKKAQKMGVQVVRGVDAETLSAFIRLNATTRRKHGLFPQPDRFFHALRKQLLEPGLGFIGAAYVDKKIVAASLFLHFNGTMYYKYNASDPAYNRYQPNNLILWDAIQCAIAARVHTFDFGRSDMHNTGLIDFKRRWATTESELRYSYFPAPLSPGNQFGSSWKMSAVAYATRIVPSRIARIIGGIIYRHAG